MEIHHLSCCMVEVLPYNSWILLDVYVLQTLLPKGTSLSLSLWGLFLWNTQPHIKDINSITYWLIVFLLERMYNLGNLFFIFSFYKLASWHYFHLGLWIDLGPFHVVLTDPAHMHFPPTDIAERPFQYHMSQQLIWSLEDLLDWELSHHGCKSIFAVISLPLVLPIHVTIVYPTLCPMQGCVVHIKLFSPSSLPSRRLKFMWRILWILNGF